MLMAILTSTLEFLLFNKKKKEIYLIMPGYLINIRIDIQAIIYLSKSFFIFLTMISLYITKNSFYDL